MAPVYFWREYGEEHSCLSQWYPCEWEFEGTRYRTAEEWMMVSKARLFGDQETALQMLEAKTPKQHKELGRQVKNFDRELWDKEKLRIVEEGNWHKFTISKDHEELAKELLATGERLLAEASPFDRIWGIGFSAANADASRSAWGENLLGQALMNVRKRLRDQQKNDEA